MSSDFAQTSHIWLMTLIVSVKKNKIVFQQGRHFNIAKRALKLLQI